MDGCKTYITKIGRLNTAEKIRRVEGPTQVKSVEAQTFTRWCGNGSKIEKCINRHELRVREESTNQCRPFHDAIRLVYANISRSMTESLQGNPFYLSGSGLSKNGESPENPSIYLFPELLSAMAAPNAEVGVCCWCPGVDLNRCKDHVVFRIHRIAGSCLRKIVRNFVPKKGPTVDE
ncbi:hypothetical protein TNCV_3365051 [Trichonephila clavipes]|nr:hypothetical protein TNCV_3365051 [Trichonephila clavipes]